MRPIYSTQTVDVPKGGVITFAYVVDIVFTLITIVQ